jgi:type II secretory pathway pseudopilin PulG
MTIIETMISIVILMVVSLALMKTSLLGMKTNVQNALRDEAVNIVEMRIDQLRNLPFPVAPAINDLTATVDAVEAPVTRTLRAFTTTYTPTRTIADLDLSADSKQITMSVSWVYSGQTFTHAVTTILRKQ